jgi:leucyl/phenylalanyl-tRNA--protein transferase
MVALIWLDPGAPFPSTTEVLDDPPGLLAAGADLSPDTLIRAYSRGIFPWFSEGEPILWWSLSPRMVLRPEQFHLSRSLKKSLRQTPFNVTIDQQFEQVARHCAETPRHGQPGTWITEEMQTAYCRLHQQGHAHSIEISLNGVLVGGLYGVCLGRVFFGESMFSHHSNASKAALYVLCLLAESLDLALIDCQMQTDHLASLGATTLGRDAFEHKLSQLVGQAPSLTNRSRLWAHSSISLASLTERYRLDISKQHF